MVLVRAGTTEPCANGVLALPSVAMRRPQPARGLVAVMSSLLVVIASAVGLRIRNLALAEEAAERKRFEQEVALAARIQAGDEDAVREMVEAGCRKILFFPLYPQYAGATTATVARSTS